MIIKDITILIHCGIIIMTIFTLQYVCILQILRLRV